ncbi:unnamed protein product [Medioppia subpectinata]|uniref:Uncharacterized protein n=1 Tax=Medioppia subpectinata TaxID=1979941 RepID=A0A7R9LWG1_9ACAR|nr:unnamed protein product [Medioppia subpectinata]CAG2122254.1 unnamed protein product [Medioppia subpectinata]
MCCSGRLPVHRDTRTRATANPRVRGPLHPVQEHKRPVGPAIEQRADPIAYTGARPEPGQS